MSVLRVIKHNWGLFRWVGLGFCSLEDCDSSTDGQRLTFSTCDLVTALTVNATFLVVSWWYLIRVFFFVPEEMVDSNNSLNSAKTLMAVSQIAFVTEQVANTLLILYSLAKQSMYMNVCNKLHEIDLFLDSQYKTLKSGEEPVRGLKNELRFVHWATICALIYYGILFVAFLFSLDTLNAVLEVSATFRPVVSDFVNLQFLSLIILANNRINRMAEHIRANGDDDGLIHAFLVRLDECIDLANREFSGIFAIQSLRLLITLDNNVYQLMMIINSGLFMDYIALLILMLIINGFSIVVYTTLALTCYRTVVAYQELGRHCSQSTSCCSGIQHRASNQMLPESHGGVAEEEEEGDYSMSLSSLSGPAMNPGRQSEQSHDHHHHPRCRGRLARIDRQSKICLHFLHQRNQRQGRGFGFTAFGVVDIDLRGVFSVSDCLTTIPSSYHLPHKGV